MWSAFMNGTGTGGGGYVPAPGWDFVPCSRMRRTERGRGRSLSPSRRISSPPTFTHIYQSQSGGQAAAGTPIQEVLRGQMWPSPEPQSQQQQQQHTRLKKKLEDLKKRHVQDKEEWMHAKESLLREVADIQVIGNIYYSCESSIYFRVCLWNTCIPLSAPGLCEKSYIQRICCVFVESLPRIFL